MMAEHLSRNPLRRIGRIQIGGMPSAEEGMPSVVRTRQRMIAFGIFIVSALAFLYFVLPKVAGLSKTWDKLDQGDPAWLVAAFGFELLSFTGYVLLFRTIFACEKPDRIDWTFSYQVTMAGVAATRLFAAAGSGGVALTVWALRRAGIGPRTVAVRMAAFMALLYFVYLGALVIDGVLLRTGIVPGGGAFAITIVPALLAGAIIAALLLLTLVPGDIERRLAAFARPTRRWGRLLTQLATMPALVGTGIRQALALVRAREIGLLGGIAWWAFDIAALWASFHAFGMAPQPAVIVMAYFVGTLGNLLPLPGGIGGVDGGMIGALIAFNVDPGLAVVAVLTYRAFSFWLPTIPGGIAYLQLRRTVQHWQSGEAEGQVTPATA